MLASHSKPLVIVPMLDRGLVSVFCEAHLIAEMPHDCGDDFGLELVTVHDVLVFIAEPISRPRVVHEYSITPFSLGAAVARGFDSAAVFRFLQKHSRTPSNETVAAPASTGSDASKVAASSTPIQTFLHRCMSSYGKVRVVVSSKGCAIQCVSRAIADRLRGDAVIATQSAGDVYDIAPDDPSIQDQAAGTAPFVAGFALVDATARKFVADRALSVYGLPVQQQYRFEDDFGLPRMHLALRTSTKPRDYQVRSVEAAAGSGTCSSGVVVLPCGAGKTLVGIMIMCAVKRPTIILCASAVSVEQWKNQVLDFASFDQQAEAQEDRLWEDRNRAVAAAESSAAAGAAPPRLHGDQLGADRSKVRPASERLSTRIACFTGKQKDKVTEFTKIIITTYSMLSVAHRAYVARTVAAAAAGTGGSATAATVGGGMGSTRGRNATAERARVTTDAMFRAQGWGLLLLDEVHVVPADFFREALSALKVKATIGLTATFVREDRKIMDLHHLVGPKLFDVSWEELQAQGFVADVTCVEVHCRMPVEFGVEYLNRRRPMNQDGADDAALVGASASTRRRRLTSVGASPLLIALAASNPTKMACTIDIVRRHNGAKTIVFCDYIELLKKYAEVLGCPCVHGETSHAERMKIFSDFECTNRLNLILVSRVGDVSVNLPSASIVIQVSSHGGSRRQEAQRLGRILRPKPKNMDGTSVHAFFYSLISDDTIETAYASHRTAFLVDQGYTCRFESYMSALDHRSHHATHGGGPVDVVNTPDDEDLAEPDDSWCPAVLQRPNRLAWLARVVASWESFGLATKTKPTGGRRRRRNGDDDDDDDDVSEGGDEDSRAEFSSENEVDDEAAAVRVKREDNDTGRSSRRQRLRSNAEPLAAVTTGDDGMVYHEFS